jgi:excinuclease ABC subunit C
MKKLPEHLQKIYTRLASIPTLPGCYIWFNFDPQKNEKVILYVGKANSLRNRIRQYFTSSDYKTTHLMAKVSDLDYVVTENELEALLLENNLIKLHSPAYNIRLKDDKTYPYLCLTLGETFPRLILTRKKTSPLHAYYGPYSDVTAARNIMELIHRVFPIRKRTQALPAKSPQKPCLNYHIGRCLAPCADKISREDYNEMIKKIKMFLDSENRQIISELETAMKDYSDRFEYEKAAIYRNIISDINAVYETQSVQKDDSENNYDVVSLYSAPIEEIAEDLDMFSSIDSDKKLNASQVVMLRIRNGNLINKTSYALTESDTPDFNEIDIFHSELFDSFFRDYYLNLTDIPGLILLNHHQEGKENWQNILNQKTAWKVRIIDKKEDPDFQSRLSLIKMAGNNAKLSLRERLLSEKIRNQRFGLKQIQKFLGLSELPEFIECYDISNIQGTNSVASGVVLKNGIPWKSAYRKYRIMTKDTPDDPAMIYEVITRRLLAAKEKGFALPDIMVIDGGITQLNAALKAREESGLNVKIVSLAKKEEIIFTDNGNTVVMDKNSPGMLIIRLARDEAHRFAVGYHRKLRSKQNLRSVLDGIPGIGPVKKRKINEILQYFTSIENNLESIREELSRIPGILENEQNLILEKLSTLVASDSVAE